MNWKLILGGGLAYYITAFIVSMPGGALIHEGILEPAYMANTEFWRPELTQDPPDMAALMPRWITAGILTTFIFAAIYGFIHTAFSGPGWKKGLMYGAGLAIVMGCFAVGYSGVFNLPDKIWAWWAAEGFLYYLPGGAMLGWLGDRFL